MHNTGHCNRINDEPAQLDSVNTEHPLRSTLVVEHTVVGPAVGCAVGDAEGAT